MAYCWLTTAVGLVRYHLVSGLSLSRSGMTGRGLYILLYWEGAVYIPLLGGGYTRRKKRGRKKLTAPKEIGPKWPEMWKKGGGAVWKRAGKDAKRDRKEGKR